MEKLMRDPGVDPSLTIRYLRVNSIRTHGGVAIWFYLRTIACAVLIGGESMRGLLVSVVGPLP